MCNGGCQTNSDSPLSSLSSNSNEMFQNPLRIKFTLDDDKDTGDTGVVTS